MAYFENSENVVKNKIAELFVVLLEHFRSYQLELFFQRFYVLRSGRAAFALLEYYAA
jgi:hypothetical protein